MLCTHQLAHLSLLRLLGKPSLPILQLFCLSCRSEEQKVLSHQSPLCCFSYLKSAVSLRKKKGIPNEQFHSLTGQCVFRWMCLSQLNQHQHSGSPLHNSTSGVIIHTANGALYLMNLRYDARLGQTQKVIIAFQVLRMILELFACKIDACNCNATSRP